jgi:hypothetical protein
MFVSFNSNMVGVTCGAGTADYSRAPEFTPVYSGVRVARSLVFCFVDRCLSFWPFSFGHRIICPSIYGFPLPFCYLQTILFFNRFLIPNTVFRQLYRSDRKKSTRCWYLQINVEKDKMKGFIKICCILYWQKMLRSTINIRHWVLAGTTSAIEVSIMLNVDIFLSLHAVFILDIVGIWLKQRS